MGYTLKAKFKISHQCFMPWSDRREYYKVSFKGELSPEQYRKLKELLN